MRRSPVDAICKVTVPGLGHGTGFLVQGTPEVVITARHVLGGRASAQLTFAAHATAATVAYAGAEDWIALACTTAPPPEVPRLELLDLDALHVKRFDSYGYARLYDPIAAPIHGDVRLGDLIFAAELTGARADAADGLSGAPCLVGDVAVGLISDSLGDGSRILGNTLRMVSARTIVAESANRLALAGTDQLPYVPVVESMFDAGGLTRAARRLEVVDPGAGAEAVLRARVARAVLVAPLTSVVEVISELQLATAKELMILCESLGLSSSLGSQTAELVRAQQRYAAINAAGDVAAADLLRAASWYAGAFGKRWYNRKRCLVVSPQGDAPDEVVAAIEATARQSLLRVPDRAALRDLCARQPPIFAAVFGILPRPEVVAALERELAGLHVLFFTGALQAAANDACPRLRPELSAGREAAWRTARDRAREQLSIDTNIDVTDDDLWK